MDYKNSYDGLDEYAANLIKNKARQLVGKAGLTQHDQSDIEQDLMIDLLCKMKHFNPAKGKKTTFMARMIERRISTIFEARFAQCRDWRKCYSLNKTIDNGEGLQTEMIELLSNDVDSNRTSDLELSSLKMDVKQVLDSLPDDLKELCLKLKENTVSEIAREMGVPRGTLYGRIKKIRNAFLAAGFEEF